MPDDILYDAFISYNQKLDKPFVMRLQRQLQDLGKAWWQRRAVRIFRDESSLSATPELWPSIERALEGSRFLIVCASPEAAASFYVNKEVAWWLEHKSRDTLLIALTAGELQWDRAANDFVWTAATPLPPAFRGAFSNEPKWTDFRAFRTLDEERRKADQAFLSLAADFSATIRGIPKEDLLSEELRQQRRALHAAYSGASCLALIAAVAAALGYLAYERGAEARRQRDAALLQQSQSVTGLSEGQDDATHAALLLEVLPDQRSSDESTRTRPLWEIAETRLNPILGTLREAAVFDGHGGAVFNVAFSPDGASILTGSEDGTARLWDAKARAELSQFKGHTGAVIGVAFSPHGSRIVTGSSDKTARVWDARSQLELVQLKGHTDVVNRVSFSPDGTRIVTGSDDKTARVWDVQSGAELVQLKGHQSSVQSVAFSPDGTRILTASFDGTARLWDSQSGAELAQLKGSPASVDSAVFSPDGTRILTASRDKTARLWDAKSGAMLHQFEGHTNWVRTAAFSPGGTRILTGSRDATVRLWDAGTGEELAQGRGHTASILSAAFGPDGAHFVTGSEDGTARLWDVHSR